MNKIQRFGVTAGVLAALAGAGIGPAAAATNTTQVVVNVRTTHICTSESETETVYRHKVNGVYVAYPTPKVEHTASLNHKLICHDTRTVKYAS
jgi:hypothetical protein